jgi:tetratricopeptide (TPR) repeat protein
MFALLGQILPLGAAPTAQFLYQEGLAHLEGERHYEAIVKFKEALDLNPRYLEPLLRLSETYYYIDEYDEALRYVSRAMPFGKENAQLLNIHGRILLALGKTEEAAAIFRSIQVREPYNIDALLGLAEFSLAKGDEITALKHFQKSLEYNQKDRRVLLSLAIMYENRASAKLAEDFLLRALQAYPESPLVQTLAAEYYVRKGNWKDAEFHGTTALSLAPQFRRAMMVVAKVRLFAGLYSECLAILDQVQNLDDRYAMVDFYKAQAYYGSGQYELAARALERTIQKDPGDEMARIVLESQVKKLEELASNENATATYLQQLQTRLGDYHYQQASDYRKKNLFARASFHYRRGRNLNPLSLDGRKAYANFLKTMGQQARFLEELELLNERGLKDAFVTDNLEIYSSLRASSVSNTWNVNQFDIERDPLVFRVFYQADRLKIDHPKSEDFVAAYFQDLLRNDKISFKIPKPRSLSAGAELIGSDEARVRQGDLPIRGSSASEAFRIAREERVDYYLMLNFEESGDDFLVTVDMYLARTGTKIKSYSAYRTGNFRIQNAIYQVVEAIQKQTPLRGRLLDRKVNDGLINLGSVDGIKVGDVLQLVSRDGYILQGEAPGFVYAKDKVTGTFTVNRVDDLVAQGTIKREGFFDRINLGDVILRDGESIVRPQDATANFPYLYNQIRGIR